MRLFTPFHFALEAAYWIAGKTVAASRMRRSELSYRWFLSRAKRYDANTPLHHGSHWSYLSARQWQILVESVIARLDPPIRDGDSLCEVGIGVGAFSSLLVRRWPNLRISGIDPVEPAVRIAREKLPAARLFVGNGLDMRAFPDASFDHVIANYVIAYLDSLEDAHHLVAEMVRVAKPGASLVLTCIVEPEGRFIGSGNIRIPREWWSDRGLGFTILSLQTMGDWKGCAHQKDRYAIYLRKEAPVDRSAGRPSA